MISMIVVGTLGVVMASSFTGSAVTRSTAVPTKIDLSQTVYFPEIGDQGELNSCASWATTYYQFTYEANKHNAIVTTPENTYSPAWTYNFVNNGGNNYASHKLNYNVLARQGALRMEDCPYDRTEDGYDYSWSTDIDAMIEALATRIEEYSDVYNVCSVATTATNKIDSPSDELLTQVKYLLGVENKVLTVAVDFSGETTTGMSNWVTKKTVNDEWAVCLASEDLVGHVLTVVGYDDTIECDINGDGRIEDSERGAFKLANSWGDEWANNGFIWVMYDALNIESANSSSGWDDAYTNRTRIFDPTFAEKNSFTQIEVVSHEVNLVGLMTYATSYRYNSRVFTGRSANSTFSNSYEAGGWTGNTSLPYPFQGTMVVDYGTLDDDIENYLSGYNWFIRVNNTSTKSLMANISYKIVDSEGVVVKDFGTIAPNIPKEESAESYATLNLQYADVDYDGAVTSSDTTLIMNYIVKNVTPSNLQKILSDYNHDGVIDVYDITAINNSLNAAEAAEFAAFLTEEYNRLASTPQTASAEQTQAYAELVTQLYELCVLNAA